MGLVQCANKSELLVSNIALNVFSYFDPEEKPAVSGDRFTGYANSSLSLLREEVG